MKKSSRKFCFVHVNVLKHWPTCLGEFDLPFNICVGINCRLLWKDKPPWDDVEPQLGGGLYLVLTGPGVLHAGPTVPHHGPGPTIYYVTLRNHGPGVLHTGPTVPHHGPGPTIYYVIRGQEGLKQPVIIDWSGLRNSDPDPDPSLVSMPS